MLERVLHGEAVAATWKGRYVARLVPAPSADWRTEMPEEPRLLAAQTQARGLTIVTRDQIVRQYGFSIFRR